MRLVHSIIFSLKFHYYVDLNKEVPVLKLIVIDSSNFSIEMGTTFESTFQLLYSEFEVKYTQ